ncbi:DAK2 domain-containing protein [Mesomycoplasma neurolyticum]|uniref:Kinase n=1 Tax=Mesomycoplasma neurolyticum TaxID=2120 RepID=A0A449A4X6_9BACT|nr:DAK2 domain-containing protein [Mesomycoplasma neurolyticum]VEU59272.1 kinase [Mesomycoplasma neurolyticum]
MIKNNELTAKLYVNMIVSGANNLQNNKEKINALNVFPVPDGDTGTNMAATIFSSTKNLKNETFTHLGEVAKLISKNMLIEARGNSGVILSQIFRGFSEYFLDKSVANNFEIVEAFISATKKAYDSVLQPVEGTLLTVIRETTETLEKTVTPKTTIEELFKIALNAARKSCDNTPNILPILKEVNVTDSGGEGLFLILEGMYNFLIGKPVEISQSQNNVTNFVSDTEIYDGEFGYCTEVIVELRNPKNFSKKRLISKIINFSSSLVVVRDSNIVKVHGHVLKPGKFLSAIQQFGEFLKIKSENMSLQANSSKIIAENETQNKKFKNAIISCNTGQGIINIMKENGAHFIIEGGQTNNPSIRDILNAIDSLEAENIFFLPNNSNIILSAQQAVQTITNKNVIIIPSKTPIQGINAVLNFSEDISWQENKELMEDAIKSIHTIEVTQANRDVKIGDVKIKNEEFIGILNGEILVSTSNYIDAAKSTIKILMKNIGENSSDLISIYYGVDSSEGDAKELADFIEANYDVEIEIKKGEQKTYHFLIGVE